MPASKCMFSVLRKCCTRFLTGSASNWPRKLPDAWKALPSGLVRISEEVSQAILDGRPVVSLESTVITHGMPWPQNLQVAQNLERIVRENGSLPATIAMLSGQLVVGLDEKQLERLAASENLQKISRRDISHSVALGSSGGTTVAATMLVSHMVGIPIFATGGCGGVHRFAETSFDISADIVELGRTPVAVVCAGIKSILDIPKTLELLETAGVTVLTYGISADFPSFFTPKSGKKSQGFVSTPEMAASVIAAQRRLSIQSGILIAAPIPNEFDELGRRLEQLIQDALEQASKRKVSGNEVTPFVLSYLNKHTSGESLKANVCLIENNVRIASQIAVALQQQVPPSEDVSTNQAGRLGDAPRKAFKSLTTGAGAAVSESVASGDRKKIVVVGGTVVDIYAKSLEAIVENGSTHVGQMFQTFGGVGRNHADALSQLGNEVVFISAVGNDHNGNLFLSSSPSLRTNAVQTLHGKSTSCYVCILDKSGDVRFGLMDSSIHHCLTPGMIAKYEKELESASLGLIDGNVSIEAIEYFIDACKNAKVPVWFEPTDRHKIHKLVNANQLKNISYISPNLGELQALLEVLQKPLQLENGDRFLENSAMKAKLTEAVNSIFDAATSLRLLRLGMGSKGALLLEKGNSSCLNAYFLPPFVLSDQLRSASGAGDCLNAGLIHGLLRNWPLENSCALAAECSRLSLLSVHAVPQDLEAALRTKQASGFQQFLY